MQRTLVVVRHAKSSWADAMQSDYDRPLNSRGEHDAPMMGERFKKKNIIPDLIIASTAKRAAQTAKKIAKAIGYDTDKIQWVEELYHCSPPVLERAVMGADKEVKTLFIVAHNPGVTEFVNSFSDTFRIDDMPTCGMLATHITLDDWKDFPAAEKQVFYFDYPKADS